METRKTQVEINIGAIPTYGSIEPGNNGANPENPPLSCSFWGKLQQLYKIMKLFSWFV